jgi:hypothetical protein
MLILFDLKRQQQRQQQQQHQQQQRGDARHELSGGAASGRQWCRTPALT